MPKLGAGRIPKYRHHRPSGQAVVGIDGRDVYLGHYGSEESRVEYERLITQWLADRRRTTKADDDPPPPSARNRRRLPDLTVNELLLAFMEHAADYYSASELDNYKQSIRPVRELFGERLAGDFGPLNLKAARQTWVERKLVRDWINKQVARVVHVFRWGVENELVAPSAWHGLKAVSGLRYRRSQARDPDPVEPAPEELVEGVRPYVSRQVWAMVELMRLTGMRPGEVVKMTAGEIDTTGPVWRYRPAEHKTAHHRHKRTIYLGPRAQKILAPWLRPELDRPLFSPAEAETERHEQQRSERKTRVQPSQQRRAELARRRRRERPPADHWTVNSFRRAVHRGCDSASPPSPRSRSKPRGSRAPSG